MGGGGGGGEERDDPNYGSERTEQTVLRQITSPPHPPHPLPNNKDCADFANIIGGYPKSINYIFEYPWNLVYWQNAMRVSLN